MATNMLPKPEVGDILVVIHDFLARSSDELSLAKGDRVELIERDDEFGDGWFLGRHLVNGNSGLFPEVYTRPPPKGLNSTTPAAAPTAKPPTTTTTQPADTNGASTEAGRPASVAAPTGVPHTSPPSQADATPAPLPLNAVRSESVSLPPVATAPLASKSFSGPAGFGNLGRLNNQSQDSPVLHETLTVIDEHMNDLHSQPSSSALHNATDSSSDYSAPLHDRMSYIQGEETDEEEEDIHTRAQVEAWNADDVAEYLFTAGVEKKHCEVFRDQEISGEVLLGMDQSTLFLKAFDLGSVGRRLKTWQKIKSLQDEVNGLGLTTRRTTQTYGSDAGSEGSKRMRSRTNTLTNPPRLPSVIGGTTTHARRLSQTTPKLDPVSPITSASPQIQQDSPTRPTHQKRPSAASVRDLHHSRRYSSTDQRLTSASVNNTPQIVSPGAFGQSEAGTHKKQPSFDRNWTMGGTSNGSVPPRPLSSSGLQGFTQMTENGITESPIDDRGYFSGTEVEGRSKRNTLKKRDTLTNHSHKGSYTDEQRVRSATALARHSRFGSVDSVSGGAAQKYYNMTNQHRRSVSVATTESIRPIPPTKDYPPTVTKLDHGKPEGAMSPISGPGRQGDWFAKGAKMSGFGGLRAISDAVTGQERAKIAVDGSTKDSPLQSPSARTGSSTPSGGPSFELDSPDTTAKSPLSSMTTGSQQRKASKKTKQETSAYQRGLAKISPREAIKDADYSGWMKKKSSNLMTTWKPRLFILKGRRLAYYYSDDDTEEKGLIDISFHRVLPADNERLTGLHATLTGASSLPAAASESSLLTGSDAAIGTEGLLKGDDSVFIFKLVPPRAGLSRAVNFTKPTVHYFAVPNLQQGRAWMAALMKATIDRDDTKPITSTYQQKTISLAKARQMRHRPPALMNLDEKVEEGAIKDAGESEEKKNGLGISFGEVDSAVSGLEKLGLHKVESSSARKPTFDNEKSGSISFLSSPQSA